MNLVIDLSTCGDLGQRARTAPDLFAIDDNGEQTLRQQAEDTYASPVLSPTEVKAAQRAVLVRLAQAITLTDG